ncbi:putative inactive receptor kinase [Camellia lanceoleosa]|uniref:Inactive receptor kinase n=1 Tax=Camellia lanceoleosa TaxID=1840588 RepID=A0ACC0HVR3_9ERIC|nr:putative inactive receptor kinase [Camellia lanceoleosa]
MARSEEEEVKQALVRFMEKLPLERSNRPNFWLGCEYRPCSGKWQGVTCDSQSQSVKRIVLDERNLTGVLMPFLFATTSSLLVLSLNDNVPPNLSKVSGLLSFLVQDNQLSGEIPKFDFSNLAQFNVSNNNFSGAIPDVKGRFNTSSFGRKGAVDKTGVEKERELHDNSNKISGTLSEFKTGEFAYRSEYSITSFENGTAASPLVVLSSPVVNGLKFEELLQAPAVLVGRGKHGSLYKVILDGGVTLAVKRIKDCRIQKGRFQEEDGEDRPSEASKSVASLGFKLLLKSKRDGRQQAQARPKGQTPSRRNLDFQTAADADADDGVVFSVETLSSSTTPPHPQPPRPPANYPNTPTSPKKP